MNTIEFISPSQFVLAGPDVQSWRKRMGRWVEGAQFTPQFKRKIWDGKQYPGSFTRQGHFVLGRGLLHRVLQDLTCTITKPPPKAPRHVTPPEIAAGTLRDFQIAALTEIFTKKWGCVSFATNAGKGAIIALASWALAQEGWDGISGTREGTRSIILCDTVSVFDALFKEIRLWTGSDPETIASGRNDVPLDGDTLVLAMVPTLYRRLRSPAWCKWLEGVEAAFLDEADKSVARSWQQILLHMPNTHYRVGFSGTFPGEGSPDELVILEKVGPKLAEVRNIDLIERGISARPVVELCPYRHNITQPKEWASYTGPERRSFIYNQGIIGDEQRHRFVESLLEPGVPNAVVVNFIEHGRELARVLPSSQFLSGIDSVEHRQSVLAAFKAGEFQTLIVSKILDRGTNDLGHTVGLVFASGEGSDRQTLQRIGRGLRRTGGKEFLYLKDVIDSGHKYLDNASKQRVELYQGEGFEVNIRHEPSTQSVDGLAEGVNT